MRTFFVVGFGVAIAGMLFAIIDYEGKERFWNVVFTVVLLILVAAFRHWVIFWSQEHQWELEHLSRLGVSLLVRWPVL
ncbi:MAG: hypothetical protein F6J98_02330 [Moorea sp. SIO4G2]|nr:hypothetical protein [Moorena sp. SIO4G2]